MVRHTAEFKRKHIETVKRQEREKRLREKERKLKKKEKIEALKEEAKKKLLWEQELNKYQWYDARNLEELYQTREELMQAECNPNEIGKINWNAWDRIVRETKEKITNIP